MKTQQLEELTFRNATFEDLEKIVPIKMLKRGQKFEKWFSFDYKISQEEEIFLLNLIDKNELILASYNEEQLKMKFIAPLLYKVNFFFDDIKDWYEYYFEAEVNGTLLKGKTDCMLARGFKTPKKPFFFIQEFKKDKHLKDPEDQILAEMLAAIKINKKNTTQGVYVTGNEWNFIILEKLKSEKYEYFVSESFNCLNMEHLKQIYINLQAVKKLFCF